MLPQNGASLTDSVLTEVMELREGYGWAAARGGGGESNMTCVLEKRKFGCRDMCRENPM